MSLVCCVVPDDACTCERVKPCGGVHVMSAGCPTHFGNSEQYEARIHETGWRPVENVRNDQL